jgi:hypothetical protein
LNASVVRWHSLGQPLRNQELGSKDSWESLHYEADNQLAESRYVIENMERETGLEPATSSLGIWAMVCFQ